MSGKCNCFICRRAERIDYQRMARDPDAPKPADRLYQFFAVLVVVVLLFLMFGPNLADMLMGMIK